MLARASLDDVDRFNRVRVFRVLMRLPGCVLCATTFFFFLEEEHVGLHHCIAHQLCLRLHVGGSK